MDLSTPPHLAIKDVPDLLDRSVLLVDDDLPARFAVASTLTDAGAAVRFAADAREAAFRCACRLDAARPFDLVIVALRPPGGADACRTLREAGYRGPILALGRTRDALAVTDAGADALLPGVMDGVTLYETAVELIGRPRIGDMRDDEAPPPVLSDLAAFPQMHVMLERFLDQLPQRLSTMADAAAAHDVDELAQLVADLKRSAGSHGFTDISREAAETERHLRATEHLRDALTPLTDLCRRATVRGDQPPTLPPSA